MATPIGRSPERAQADEPGSAATEAAAPGDIALGKARATAAPTRRGMPAWVGPAVAGALFLVAVPFAVTLRLDIVVTLSTALMMIVIAQGWNLLGGYGGYLNFGMAVFFGTGVYTAAWLNSRLGWSLPATMPVAALAGAVASLPVGLATLRLRGSYFAILTLVLTFLAQIVAINTKALGGANGIYTTVEASGPRQLAARFYWTLLALAVLATAVAWLVQRANFGHALRAIREDEDAAAVLGVRTSDVKLRALLLGAGFAGLAGSVYAFQTGYIEPTGTFDFSLSLDVVLICVLGGLGTWQGPLIGGLVVVLLEQWLRTSIPSMHPFGLDIPPEANRVVLGLLLVLFALYAKQGVVGLFRQRRGRRLSV
jgi:branched-chain amino acid transport system permease protein